MIKSSRPLTEAEQKYSDQIDELLRREYDKFGDITDPDPPPDRTGSTRSTSVTTHTSTT